MLIVASRTTEITFPGRKSPVRALVPVLDLMNYSIEQSVAELTDRVNLKEGIIDFVIANNIEANEQVRAQIVDDKEIYVLTLIWVDLHSEPVVCL